MVTRLKWFTRASCGESKSRTLAASWGQHAVDALGRAGEAGRIMNPQAAAIEEQHAMMITTKDGAQIYYKDWGTGQPIVFSHGWPLSADDWDTQMQFFLKHGYRVIAHDRRGHGHSSQTGGGHDMDHYADDLAALTAHLDLKGGGACRPLDRRRRSGALPGAPRRNPGGKGGDHQRSATVDGEDGGQSGGATQGR